MSYGDSRRGLVRGPRWGGAAPHADVAGVRLCVLGAPRLLAVRAPRPRGVLPALPTLQRPRLAAVGRRRRRGPPPPYTLTRFRRPNPRLT